MVNFTLSADVNSLISVTAPDKIDDKALAKIRFSLRNDLDGPETIVNLTPVDALRLAEQLNLIARPLIKAGVHLKLGAETRIVELHPRAEPLLRGANQHELANAEVVRDWILADTSTEDDEPADQAETVSLAQQISDIEATKAWEEFTVLVNAACKIWSGQPMQVGESITCIGEGELEYGREPTEDELAAIRGSQN